MFNFKTENDYIINITKNIEKQRIRQNLTQEELSQKAGISPSTYNRFLKGGNISFKNFISILYSLELDDKLEYLEKIEEYESIDDIRNKNKKEKKRVKKHG